jgi:transposase
MTPRERVGAIRAWCKRVRSCQISQFDREGCWGFPSIPNRGVESFLRTIETWLEQIANYFLERITSSFVEGFNNRVKVLKRRCYGIFDVDRLFQRLTLDIHGSERLALN